MVGVNSVIHRFGTVAIFATLFVAIQVNAEKGCVFDSEHLSDLDLECNNLKHSWTTNEDAKDKKKTLALEPDRDGCLKTKNTVTLNLSSPIVSLRFHREGTKNENEKITLRLIPKEGSCPDEECVWDITSDPQYKSGEWISAEHKFPLKIKREFYVQLEVEKGKEKFHMDRITLPSASGDSSRCQEEDPGITAAEEAGMNEVNLPSRLIAAEKNESNYSPRLSEISKNLMLTSASVLTLNTLLN